MRLRTTRMVSLAVHAALEWVCGVLAAGRCRRVGSLGLATPAPGYWVEIIKRGEGVAVRSTAEADLGRPVLCQTMIRVKVGT